MTQLKLAAAHIAPILMDLEASTAKAIKWIKQAGEDGIDLVVFPEVFLPGFPYWINCYPPLVQAGLNRRYQDLSVEADGPEMTAICAAAKAASVAVVMGASERGHESRTCYNTSFIIDKDGTLLLNHRKLKPTYAERYIWGQGDGSTLKVVPTAVGRVGALACWEHMMNLARQALADQNMQIHAGLWPGLSTMAGFEDVANMQTQAVMQAHAITAQTFVVNGSSPVTQQMLDFLEAELGPTEFLKTGGGWSAIIHPFGPIIGGPVSGTDDQLVVAEVNMDDLSDVKMWVDTSGHYSRPDVVSVLLNDEPLTPTIKYSDD